MLLAPFSPHRTPSLAAVGAVIAACALASAAACRSRAGADAAGPVVRDAWVRAAPAGASAAAYLTLVNRGPRPVILTGGRTPAAASVTLHESMTTGVGAHAMMRMAPLARVEVAPGDSAVFAPLGRHLMLEGLTRPLAAGERVPLTLRTAAGDPVVVTLAVRPLGAP